jgi:hypothetical protein
MTKSAIVLTSAFVLWSRVHNPPETTGGWTPLQQFESKAECLEMAAKTVNDAVDQPRQLGNLAVLKARDNAFIMIYGKTRTIFWYDCFPLEHFPTY